MTSEGPLSGTRVLVAHRSQRARRSLRDALESLGASVAEAASPAQVAAAAHALDTDVVLLHQSLGATLADVKGDPDLLRVAVVLVGDPDVDATLDALGHGAHDVLRERASTAEIVARVRAARRVQELQDRLLRREHDLEALAYHDELTDLPNRRYAVRQLHALLSRGRRHGHDLSVVMLDADGFKALNDRHGHQAGDEVLRAVAARLRARARTEDLVARYGGEEFLVVLPDTDAAGAAAVAEGLREAVAAQPFTVGDEVSSLTVSAGWATWAGESLQGLLARADAGLYAAKAAGRDQVRPGPEAVPEPPPSA